MGKMFSLGLCLYSEPDYSPVSAFYSQMRKKTHYCGPDGNIPHDQTNQSHWWDAGVTQPCSNTPFHSLSGTNTWSPINGTLRTHEEGCFSAASLVHGWWLHNHTSILSEERGDELPNNVSHHGNTNTVMDTASAGTLTCSPAAHFPMWGFTVRLREGCPGKRAHSTSWRNVPQLGNRIKSAWNIKVRVDVWFNNCWKVKQWKIGW